MFCLVLIGPSSGSITLFLHINIQFVFIIILWFYSGRVLVLDSVRLKFE